MYPVKGVFEIDPSVTHFASNLGGWLEGLSDRFSSLPSRGKEGTQEISCVILLNCRQATLHLAKFVNLEINKK